MLENMKRIHRKYKLRHNMILINLFISIIPLVIISIIFYNIFITNIEEKLLNSLQIYFNQIDYRLDEYLNTVDLIADSVFLDKKLQEILLSKSNTYWDKYTEIDSIIESFLKFNESVRDIYIKDQNNLIYHSMSVIVRDEFKDLVGNVNTNGMKSGKLVIEGPINIKGSGSFFLAYRIIQSVFYDNFLENIAVGAIILDGQKIESIIEENNLPDNSYIFIQNQQGKIITANDNEILDYFTNNASEFDSEEKYINIQGTDYILKTGELNRAGWNIQALISREKIIEEGEVVKNTLFVIVILVSVIVLITTLLFNYRLTFPLKKIADAFDRVASGDFDYQLKFNYKNEITEIEDNFNNMIKEIENLTNSLLDSQKKNHMIELEKKQHQLDGLQSQINAHFLYNSLNTIRVMALTDSKDEMNEMIRNLVDYLRYITTINEFVLLEDELRQLEKYKKIEMLRFGNKFKIKYKIAKDMNNLRILKLTLQPILENAIFHGLRQISSRGVIQIEAFRKSNKGIIKIMDNGKGMERSQLEKINQGIKDQKTFSDSMEKGGIGIGLVNIHKRIQLYYGEEYGIRVKSWSGIGTVVYVTYPYDTGQNRGGENV